eukprot:gene12079-14272_t
MSSAEELAEDLKRKELQAEFERLRAEAKASLNELRSENNTYLKDLRVHGEEIEAAHEKQKDLISELKSEQPSSPLRLAQMFSSTGWALKRLYKFVLKQLLGRVLKNELDLDQLDVALGSGTVELRNLVLDCDYLSEQLAELPIIVVTGEVSTVKASIPWTALGSQSCVIELGDLYLRIAPRPALSDFSSEVHGSGSEEDEPVDEPTYLAADDGIHVIAALVEKVLLRMQVRINGLSIDIQGQEPRAHIPQPGSPSAEELPTPFLHVLVARVEYEAQAPPEAGERPVPLEDALKHIKCEGVVLELSEQVVTDAPEPTSEEELTGSLCCEESHCIFSSPDSASSVSAAVQLKLGRPADPLAPLKVDLSLVLSPVQLSLSPNRIAIIKRLLESFTGEEDATQPAPPPPAPLRPTPKTTASSVASRNCSAHGIITDLFRMEGAMSMAEALPWVMDSAVSGGALPSAAAARPGAQSDSSVVPAVASAAVVANTAVTAAAMSADLAASVEEFFDCYDGSMLSSRRTDDGSASALDASGSNTQLWAWASTAWSSIQQSGLAGGMEEPSSQPVPSMELQVHVVSELVVLATAMTDAPLQGGAEGAGTTMGWMAVEASRCQVSAHIAAAQRDLSVELGALTVRHTLTPPAGVESAETSLVAAALPPWPAGAGPDLLVAEEPPAPPNGAAASPILRIGNPRASPAGGALSLKLHLSQGSQTPPPREAPASKGEVRGPGGPLPAAAGALQCSLHVPPAMLWVDDAAVVQLLHLAHAMLSAASPETPPREVGAAAPRPKEAPLPPRLTLDVQMPYLRAVGRFGAAGAPHRTGEVDPQRSFICLEVLGLPAPPPIATDGPPRPSGTVAVDAAAAMLSFESSHLEVDTEPEAFAALSAFITQCIDGLTTAEPSEEALARPPVEVPAAGAVDGAPTQRHRPLPEAPAMRAKPGSSEGAPPGPPAAGASWPAGARSADSPGQSSRGLATGGVLVGVEENVFGHGRGERSNGGMPSGRASAEQQGGDDVVGPSSGGGSAAAMHHVQHGVADAGCEGRRPAEGAAVERCGRSEARRGRGGSGGGGPELHAVMPRFIEDYCPEEPAGDGSAAPTVAATAALLANARLHGVLGTTGGKEGAAQDDYRAFWYGPGPSTIENHVAVAARQARQRQGSAGGKVGARGAAADTAAEGSFAGQQHPVALAPQAPHLPPVTFRVRVHCLQFTWCLVGQLPAGAVGPSGAPVEEEVPQAEQRVQVRLEELGVQYAVFEEGHHYASQLSVSVHELEVNDLSLGAIGEQVLRYYVHAKTPRESQAAMLSAQLEAVRPDPANLLETEYRFELKLPPLQIFLDQRVLAFLENFARASADMGAAAAAGKKAEAPLEESAMSDASERSASHVAPSEPCSMARQAVWSAAQVTIDVRLRQVVVVDVADAVHTHAVDMVQAAVDGWLTVLEELQASGAAPATVACSVGDTPAWALKVESAAASISVLRSTPGGDAGRMLRVWAEGLAAFQAASPAAGRSCTQIWAREWGVHGELEQDSAASGTTAARTATCELLCCNEASKGGGAPKGLAVELLSRPQAGSRHGACGDDLPVSETVIGVECWGLALKTLHGDLRFSWLQDLAACLQAPAPEAAPPPAQEAETQTVVCVDIHDLLLCHCPAESDDDGGGSASDAMSSGSWGAASASLAPAPPVPGALCVRHVALLSQDPALASRGGFLAAGQAPGRSQPPECSAPRLMTTLRSAVLHVVADAAGGLYKGAALPCSFAALHAEGYTRVARDVSLEVRLGQEGGSGKGSAATEVLEAEEEPMFFQRAEVSVGRLYVDYHARHVDYGALCAGSLWEFINLVPWNGVELKLRPACVSGVHGWDAVLEGALGEWQHDISKQLHKFVQGVAPVKSLCTVGNGTAQLVLEPLKQYRREGRVLRGLQKGTAAFMRSVTLEALGLGAHVAGGARHVLESAERGLGEGPPQGGSPLGTARNGAAKAGHSARRDEPGDALEGLQRAARTLTQGLGDAADVLVSKPMRRYSEGAGASAAIASAIRAVPRAAVTPAAAAATAMQQTLVG